MSVIDSRVGSVHIVRQFHDGKAAFDGAHFYALCGWQINERYRMTFHYNVGLPGLRPVTCEACKEML